MGNGRGKRSHYRSLDNPVEYRFTLIAVAFRYQHASNPEYADMADTTIDQDYDDFREVLSIEPFNTRVVTHHILTHDDNKKEPLERLNIAVLRHGLDQDIESGPDFEYKTTILVDNDIELGIQVTRDWTSAASLHKKALFIGEGDDASYDVWINGPPSKPVEVSVTNGAGDADLSVLPTTVTFNPDDWLKRYTFVASANADSDSLNGTREARHAVSSADPSFARAKTQRVFLSEMDTTQDGEGSKIWEDDPGGSDMTVTAKAVPHRHDGEPYFMELEFSEPLRNGYKSVMNLLTQGSHFTDVQGVHRVDGSSARWAVKLNPTDNMFTSLVVKPTGSCATGFCSRSGKPLQNKLVISVAPEGKGDAKHPPGETDKPVLKVRSRSHAFESISITHGITIQVSPSIAEEITFEYATFDLPSSDNPSNYPLATPGVDYKRAYKEGAIPAANSIWTAPVIVLNDQIAENAEIVGVVIFNVSDNVDLDGELNFNDVLVDYIVILDDD